MHSSILLTRRAEEMRVIWWLNYGALLSSSSGAWFHQTVVP
jgi:hypothetical protein